MIDQKLYCETFSRLHASEEAKKEVFQMKKKKPMRLPKILRSAAIAAAMCTALAATAGAVNLATDGELFRQLTIVWAGGGSFLAEDDQGNAVKITLEPEGQVTVENGRMLLHTQGQEIDITDMMEITGSYHYEYDMTVVHEDGSEEIRTISIDITGSPEHWTLTQDNGDGTTYTTTSENEEAIAFETDEPGGDAAEAASEAAADTGLPAAAEPAAGTAVPKTGRAD